MDVNRKTAYRILFNMEKNDSYSNIETNNRIIEMKPTSPAFVRELVYGVLKNKFYLDYLLQQLVSKNLDKMKTEPHILLRMGLYQLIFMNSVPDYAAVNETVKMAKKICFYQTKMVNGVLRNFLRKKDELKSPATEKDLIKRLSITYSYEPWIVKLWVKQYGEEKAEDLMNAGNLVPPFTIRVNDLLTNRDSLYKSLRNHGLEVEKPELCEHVLNVSGHGIMALPEFEEGMFYVQDIASSVAVESLEPKPGEFLIDVCAAPGGKTITAAELMGNNGKILAFDIFENKIKLINDRAKRLGIDIIDGKVSDATILNEDLIGVADKVICDVPCTGLGVIRRKPEIKYKKIFDNGKDLAEKQLIILQNASHYLKKDGLLLYSTCTINSVENSDVVEAFLRNNPNFKLISHRQLMPVGENSDGFYYCILKKKY